MTRALPAPVMAGLSPKSEQVWKAICGSQPNQCVCWVGSTSEADAAVALARELNQPKPCHVVFCLDSPSRLDASSSAGRTRRRPLTPEVIGAATAMLRDLYGNDANAMVLPGEPLAEIRRYVRTHDIKLVIMGEQALAIEAEYGARLIDDPPCPVLIFVNPARLDREH